jgi:ATP-dependent Clp protease ATP-binding subunit ClpA
MGARPLKRYIQDNITNALSDEILFGKLKNGGEVKVTLDAESAELVLEFEELDDTSGK